MDVLTGQKQWCHRQEILATLCRPRHLLLTKCGVGSSTKGPDWVCKQETKDLANNPATSCFPTCGTETHCGSATFTVVQFTTNETQMCNINLVSI